MTRIILIGIFLISFGLLQAQDEIKTLEGIVTFQASNNTYVRFGSTEKISIGDTLMIGKSGILTPCLKVINKSSSSCICEVINDCEINKDDKVVSIIANKKPTDVTISKQDSLPLEDTAIDEISSTKINENTIIDKVSQRVLARFSAATYSNLSSEENDDRHRMMLRMSLNAHNIQGSKFSFESYMNYRRNIRQVDAETSLNTNTYNIYSLALNYDLDSTMRLSLGRKINRKISSIGPVDGLQVEKYVGNFYIGGVAGFKPDFTGFGFNADLFEYGGFIGHHVRRNNLYSMTTVGLLEQKNGGATDRRYAYLQHSSTINRNLSLFSSIELDIYDNVNGISSSSPRLTNLYTSLRYRVNRRLSFMVSYDSRKRIIYYETLQTDVERLLADDEARQGVRFRVNYKPFKYINTSFSYNKRFQNGESNKSDNINGYISHSKIPAIGGRLSLTMNSNKSNYLRSFVYSVRYNRSLVKKKLDGMFYYRNASYFYLSSENTSSQAYYGANFSLRLTKSLRLSLLGELSVRQDRNLMRINTKLIKRFDTKD